MATRSAQIGFGVETTFGVYATPTRFLEFNNADLKYDIERIESAGLRAGTRVQRSSRWVAGKKSVGGSIEFEVANKNFGLIFSHMLGGVDTITTPGGGTITRDHTVLLADPTGKSLTIQEGIPDITNVSQPFSFLGCKFVNWSFSNSPGEMLMLKLEVDGQDAQTSSGLASASYATADAGFSFTGCTVNVGGVAFDATDIEITGNPNLKTDRYFLRSSALKKEQIANAFYDIGGTVSAEYTDNTAYNRFVNGTIAQIDATWSGAVIEGAFNYEVKLTMPACRFEGETPTIPGPELTAQPLPFSVLDDSSNQPLTLRYRTTDTVQ